MTRLSPRRCHVWALALLVASAQAQVARAEDVEALVRKGIALRKAGDDQQALEVFRRAAAIDKTPRVSAQLGLAEQALGQWVPAEADLQSALDAKDDRWIAKNRAALADALNTVQEHVGSIEVWGTPAGAEVLVDGAVVGTLPDSGQVHLPVGKVTLVVRHAGYAEATRVVEVLRGRVSRENIDLHAAPVEPLAAADPQATRNPTPALLATNGTGAQAADESAPRADDHPFYKRWWFWTLVGVAVAGGATGAYLLTHGGSSGPGCDPGISCGNWAAGAWRAPIGWSGN